MFYEISDDIRKCTGRCVHHFQCLKKGGAICPISEVREKTFIVKGPKHLLCSYFLSYGDIFYCLCPTRQELYTRHGI